MGSVSGFPAVTDVYGGVEITNRAAGLSDAHAKGFPDAYQTRVTR